MKKVNNFMIVIVGGCGSVSGLKLELDCRMIVSGFFFFFFFLNRFREFFLFLSKSKLGFWRSEFFLKFFFLILILFFI